MTLSRVRLKRSQAAQGNCAPSRGGCALAKVTRNVSGGKI